MQVSNIGWSKTEEQIAQKAFQKAYQREISNLIKQVRDNASQIIELDDLWRLNDFLSARRHDIDGKYAHQNSHHLFVFAELIQQGWLYLDDLEGLSKDKLTKISVLTRM